ncbi:MAG TPA: hypothetical protein VGL75_00605 [Acidothermaceae bacterium]|jgi:hypothetical protein
MKVRLGWAMAMPLAVLCLSACGPDHHQAENTTDSVLTPDKGEIKGTLTTLGGPGSSPQPVRGIVDVYTLGGKQVSDISPVSAFNFELKPGSYSVQATAGSVACNPVVVKIVKGTIQDIDMTCPTS